MRKWSFIGRLCVGDWEEESMQQRATTDGGEPILENAIICICKCSGRAAQSSYQENYTKGQKTVTCTTRHRGQ